MPERTRTYILEGEPCPERSTCIALSEANFMFYELLNEISSNLKDELRKLRLKNA